MSLASIMRRAMEWVAREILEELISWSVTAPCHTMTKSLVGHRINQVEGSVFDAVESVLFVTHQKFLVQGVTVAPGWTPFVAVTLTTEPWVTAPHQRGSRP